MFGFLWALLVGGAALKDSIDNEVEKNRSRMHSSQKGYDTYRDMKGHEYYKDRRVITSNSHLMPNGEWHKVILDAKTYKIIKDYTQEMIDSFFEERENIIKNAEKNGDLYYRIECPHELLREEKIYKTRIKGYCGSFETTSGRRYVLEHKSEYQYGKIEPTNRCSHYYGYTKHIYLKYYYEESHIGIDDCYYKRSNPIKISKEEYELYGGENLFELENYKFVSKGGII